MRHGNHKGHKRTGALSGIKRSPMTNTRREVILMQFPQLNVPFLGYSGDMLGGNCCFLLFEAF